MKISKLEKLSYASGVNIKKAVRSANRNMSTHAYTVRRAYTEEYNLPLKVITRTTNEGKNTRIIAYNQKNGKPVQFSRHYPNGIIFYDNKIKKGFVIDRSKKETIELPKFKDTESFANFWRNTLKNIM